MEIDFQVLIYIIFIAIAILSRFLKARKKRNQPQEYEETPNAVPEKSKPTSFEDLLKEFTSTTEEEEVPSQNRRTQEEPTPVREYEFKSNIPDDTEVDEIYEDSKPKKQVSNIEKEAKRPIFEHFAEYDNEEGENEMANEIKEMLSKPSSAAKAVVLSEILNRKN